MEYENILISKSRPVKIIQCGDGDAQTTADTIASVGGVVFLTAGAKIGNVRPSSRMTRLFLDAVSLHNKMTLFNKPPFTFCGR